LAAANHWQVTQAFASPAVWDKLSRHGESKRGLARGPAEDQPPNETTSVPVPFSIPTLRKIFSCGAPVPAVVLQRTLAMVHPKVEMHTPYGATEALPIATIEAQQVLSETAAKTRQGAGVCVGRKFGSIEWKIIRISDEPIGDISEAQELPPNQIGELIVRGPQVSPEYVLALQPQAEDANAAAKIRDGNTNWHRMGDVGYFDDQHRFWYCGRKSHRVETAEGTLYTECVEAIFNEVCGGPRCALVGMKSRNEQLAVLVVSIFGMGIDPQHQKRINFQWGFLEQLLRERSSVVESTRGIAHFLPYPRPLPVDVRHNSKINREQLAAWAADQLQKNPGAFSPRSVTGG
jgi:acyl-CoA synthetase (AMP-forming)/AMP-acid ligase II